MSEKINVVIGSWDSIGEQATAIRTEVFVQEQHVPPEEELDAEDTRSIHAVAYDENRQSVGTGRLLPNAHIGRMAVRKPYRGTGVGSLLLGALITEARKQGYPQVVLAAQVHAIAFYARHGFVAEGDVFMDAGIEHVAMRLGLQR